ncbi:hypothetical protein [Polaribacter sp. Q13]|uniref:hypothetical protein n=1 Tax=Polaribacter sp. Q13 TaxID=2806551 RepID=UPI00193BF79D|nr:hypothetical protein [Polaribacter sp. Q13]QVY66341.1 hypothetical protein JOP69_03345 [Polaribacter sp. Q13]
MSKLSIKNHLYLLIMSFLTWGFFVLVGLPDYYQSWSYEARVLIVILVSVLYVPLTPFLLKKMFPNKEYFKNSLWLAFYLTVPLFTYDAIFIGIIGGEGLKFIPKYWILTFFYFSFWLQFPLIALLMEKNLEEENKPSKFK